MPGCIVPGEYGEAEFVEKRSRFIGRVWYCEREEEALERIREMQKRHWDATHNVYAYIIRGGATRFSDDGEPSGTSGMPTLDVFRKAGVQNVCCVVTRYFGGILLGGGGLVRAYGRAASLALESAGRRELRRVTLLSVPCPYSLYERVRLEAERAGSVEDADFAAAVTLRVALPEQDAPNFIAAITNLTNGTVRAEPIGIEERAEKII